MALNNIFFSSNPINLPDCLWKIVGHSGNDFSDDIIFLPSRRAVRTVEKLFVRKAGGAVLLPRLIALGEAPDEEPDFEIQDKDTVSNTERLVVLSKLLLADPSIKNFGAAISVAHDLLRMQDYLENESVNAADINWTDFVDEKYAVHFREKAKFLSLVSGALPQIFKGKITSTQKRNTGIRSWIGNLNNYNRVIVCGSTASVRPSADLMRHIAGLSNGYIILPGKISGNTSDFELDTNPYVSQYSFLKSVDADILDIKEIDTGSSDIDFYNSAFGNTGQKFDKKCRAKLIECARESEEAAVAAEIAVRAMKNNKTVLIITPDSAGNQRIAQAFEARGITADFSGGRSGGQMPAARAILNFLDEVIEDKSDDFEKVLQKNNFNLFDAFSEIIDTTEYDFSPVFEIDSDESAAVWGCVLQLSDALFENGINLDVADIRAAIADSLSGVSVRGKMKPDAKIAVLGTIESRMQSADIIILTGLNEGMFPARGYKNAWLPKHITEKIGLPSEDRKVSLMALDFMNLSCGQQVYWLRSKTAGSSQTSPSRFISRASVASNGIDSNDDILVAVRSFDDVPHHSLDYIAPRPPADVSDVYVTALELLIHNPYAFYCRHFLKLYPMRDFWEQPDARDFGNLVHDVIEELSESDLKTVDKIIEILDKKAREILPAGSAIFAFWHKRFIDMAPAIEQMFISSPSGLAEVIGSVKIAGRVVKAKADRIWDGYVLDIKTGAAPSKNKLLQATMPQLPLEAYIMQCGGFPSGSGASAPVIQFLQLQNKNVKLIEYDSGTVQEMIDESLDKFSQLFGRYSKDAEEYEYREQTEIKYHIYDDLARVDD